MTIKFSCWRIAHASLSKVLFFYLTDIEASRHMDTYLYVTTCRVNTYKYVSTRRVFIIYILCLSAHVHGCICLWCLFMRPFTCVIVRGQLTCMKVYWSKWSLVRKAIGPEVRWSNIHWSGGPLIWKIWQKQKICTICKCRFMYVWVNLIKG